MAGARGISCSQSKEGKEEKSHGSHHKPHISGGCAPAAASRRIRGCGVMGMLSMSPPSPCCCSFWGHLQPPSPARVGTRPPRVATRCLIRSALSSSDLREGQACHYGLSYRAAAQQQIIPSPAAFSVSEPWGWERGLSALLGGRQGGRAEHFCILWCLHGKQGCWGAPGVFISKQAGVWLCW